MAHSVDIHVGRQLKNIRTKRRLSQTDVARRLGLSFQQIQKYEIGSNRIAASRLYELSHILDVPTSYFFDGLDSAASAASAKTGNILEVIASIKDEGMRSRIVSYIETLIDTEVARKAS